MSPSLSLDICSGYRLWCAVVPVRQRLRLYLNMCQSMSPHALTEESACTFFQSIVSDSDPQEEQNFFRHACHSYLWDNVAETWRVILIFAKLTFLSYLMNYNDFNPKIEVCFCLKMSFFLLDQIECKFSFCLIIWVFLKSCSSTWNLTLMLCCLFCSFVS